MNFNFTLKPRGLHFYKRIELEMKNPFHNVLSCVERTNTNTAISIIILSVANI